MSRPSTLKAFALAWLSVAALSCRAEAEELTVSAAVSLKETLLELSDQFQKTHPKDKVVLNLGSSSDLAQQIIHGAPADVFASAGSGPITKLSKRDLLAGEARVFARNSIVVIQPRDISATEKVNTLADLAKAKSIAIGDPAANPSGNYSKQALEHVGIYDSLLAGHKIVFAQNVRQCLAYVEKSSVSAGIVYATDAKTSDKVTVCCSIPAAYSEPILYQIAVITGSKHAKLGQDFVDLVMSAQGREIFQKRGFK